MPRLHSLYNYWRSSSSAPRAHRPSSRLKGIDYDYVAVNLVEGEQRSETLTRRAAPRVECRAWCSTGRASSSRSRSSRCSKRSSRHRTSTRRIPGRARPRADARRDHQQRDAAVPEQHAPRVPRAHRARRGGAEGVASSLPGQGALGLRARDAGSHPGGRDGALRLQGHADGGGRVPLSRRSTPPDASRRPRRVLHASRPRTTRPWPSSRSSARHPHKATRRT